ncbi:hypothetical protein VE03_06316 [Pseudogymnoascus sp. 23342-1-I1]|nr:hypothetical protein VE03_06316 [Pseudogymnoascus sp. 23342-1-I1]
MAFIMTPERMVAIKKRQAEIQESIVLCATAPFSRVTMMEQAELRKLMLNLGVQRPTREPGNTMRREIMNLHGEKFHAYVKYAEIWDTVVHQIDAYSEAEDHLRNMKGHTLEELERAVHRLKHFLESSMEVLNHGYPLICMLTEHEALSLRQLVAAQGEVTISRQDRYYYLLKSIGCKMRAVRVREAVSKPFKCCHAEVKKLCRKFRKARKKMVKKWKKARKARKAKKADGLFTG